MAPSDDAVGAVRAAAVVVVGDKRRQGVEGSMGGGVTAGFGDRERVWRGGGGLRAAGPVSGGQRPSSTAAPDGAPAGGRASHPHASVVLSCHCPSPGDSGAPYPHHHSPLCPPRARVPMHCCCRHRSPSPQWNEGREWRPLQRAPRVMVLLPVYSWPR